MEKPLNGDDVLKLVNYKSNLIAYPKLANYNSIDEVLGKYNCCIILYLTGPSFGHWVCLIRHRDKTIEFFDSYGIPLDKELGFVTKTKRQFLNQNMPYLSKLLFNYPYEIIYNDRKIQKDGKGMNINTCGRHVAMRILNRHLDVDRYIDLLKSDPKYSCDELVTILTS